MRLLKRGRVYSERHHGNLSYSVWLEPPRRRTVLVNTLNEESPRTLSLEWPWMIFMILKRGRELYSLVALASKTEPKDFDLSKEYAAPDFGHTLGFFGVCLGDGAHPKPIESFWNTSFNWKWPPNKAQWDYMLWEHAKVTPQKVLDVAVHGNSEIEFMRHTLTRYRMMPRQIPMGGRVMLTLMPLLLYASAAFFGVKDMWLLSALSAGAGWIVSGLVSSRAMRAYYYAYRSVMGAHHRRDTPEFLDYLAGPLALVGSFVFTEGFRYGVR